MKPRVTDTTIYIYIDTSFVTVTVVRNVFEDQVQILYNTVCVSVCVCVSLRKGMNRSVPCPAFGK